MQGKSDCSRVILQNDGTYRIVGLKGAYKIMEQHDEVPFSPPVDFCIVYYLARALRRYQVESSNENCAECGVSAHRIVERVR